MTKIVFCFLLIGTLIFSSCEKADLSPTIPTMDTIDGMAIEKYMGVFMNGPYGQVNGNVKVVVADGKYQLVLDEFMTSNGPDLKVYLSKQVQPINFIKLGDLKSTSGKQVYEIPPNTDFSEYKFALIHCEQFNHLFGSAELK